MKEKPIKINGKEYPFWSQFVHGKEKFIGGTLQDFGDNFDPLFIDESSGQTEITDIMLCENGKTDAWFEIAGKDFSCGFSTEVGGITTGEEGWLTFSGYGGHTFRIKPAAPPNSPSTVLSRQVEEFDSEKLYERS